jgi:hypothetical protein
MYKNDVAKSLLECYNQTKENNKIVEDNHKKEIEKTKFNLRREFIECTNHYNYNEQTCKDIINKMLEWNLVEK